MIEWALRYIRLGWPVIPLRGKLPLTEHGSKDATLNESTAREWWARWPNANVGLATGHRFFAVDVDVKLGGEETWDMLRAQHGNPPATIEQTTGTGGRHLLYALPDFPVLNSQGKIGPGVDIRGVGGYIVTAPSIHPETKRPYDWDGIAELEEQTIAAAPGWLLRLIREAEQRKAGAPAAVSLPGQISEGTRNGTLFKAGCRLRRLGFSAEEIYASLCVTNSLRCKPPLDTSEVKTIADSAGRYDPEPRANLFGNTDGGQAAAPPAGELPLTQSDVEDAARKMIASNDLAGAVDMAPMVAKLSPSAQALITAKFRVHFKDFPTKQFEKVLAGEPRVIQMPPGPPGDGDGAGPGEWPDLTVQPHTDSGNAERILAMFREDIRFCIEMQKWLVWDGLRWAVDERGVVTYKAKLMAREMYKQAINNTVLGKWARTSESQAGIAAALKRAAVEPGVPISAAELDQQIYLLNCKNGVLDLRTGELLPHDRTLLITKLCPIDYDPRAECNRFLQFLHWAMGDNPDAERTTKTVRLIAFLQRAFGYSLTADVSEKAAFVFWGAKGNNGKTTLLTTFRTMLNEYSAQISIDTLMTQRGSTDSALRADLADLRAARFVTTSEVEKEHKLSEGKLKYITAGMGKIKSCRKYENPIEFDATHKLFMDCNHRPEVRGSDDAIWRRLKPVPFEVSIADTDPEMDKKLIEKLTAEGPGILAWAVRGCMAWVEHGLGEPPEITEANTAWREHDDPLKEFFEDCCEVEPEAWVRSAELTAAYVWWCKENHERFPLGRERFGERVSAKGFGHSRSRRTPAGKQIRSIEGVRVKDEVARRMTTEGGGWRGTAEE